MKLTVQFVDIHKRKIYPAQVKVSEGKLTRIDKIDSDVEDIPYMLPGFIDAHAHIESALLPPSEFARIATIHGTVAAVSDPIGMANVMGIEGVRYMIQNGKEVPFKFYFGASPCAPTTVFETAGGGLTPSDVETLFEKDKLPFLSEVSNVHSVLHRYQNIIEKIQIAKKYNKPIDGHCPGLSGENLSTYCHNGITTEHECTTLDEALEKIKHGMKIIIREGSGARNFDALHPLFKTHPGSLMLCSGDLDPGRLVQGHINQLVIRALDLGYDLFDVLRAASLNPALHYDLDVGLLSEGDPADFILCKNLSSLDITQTFINGKLVAEEGKPLIDSVPRKTVNHFTPNQFTSDDFLVPHVKKEIKVIKVLDGSLYTEMIQTSPLLLVDHIVCDTNKDIIKITIANRYKNAKPSIAFVKGFGLQRGAIATSLAHHTHNVLAIGVSDHELALAINNVMNARGGIAVVDRESVQYLPLPIGGIMSDQEGPFVAKEYKKLEDKAKELGSPLKAPLMTLAFMSLLVVPELKLSDMGLFDTKKFELTTLDV